MAVLPLAHVHLYAALAAPSLAPPSPAVFEAASPAMPYMLLIVEPVGQRLERTPSEGQAVWERMLRYADDLQQRGVLLASESLEAQAAGARVRVRAGKAQVVDGPFVEAKEMIGGFFLVDVATREEAVALAAECPAAEWCAVEVRAVAPCSQ